MSPRGSAPDFPFRNPSPTCPARARVSGWAIDGTAGWPADKWDPWAIDGIAGRPADKRDPWAIGGIAGWPADKRDPWATNGTLMVH